MNGRLVVIRRVCEKQDLSNPVLFCPFCEASYSDGETHCPAHELPLVDLKELGDRKGKAAPGDDEEVALASPKYGRGFFFVSVVLAALGFVMPFAARSDSGEVWSTVALASQRAMNLWSIPLLILVILQVLTRRRTPVSMRSARVALLVLSLGIGVSAGYTAWRIANATAEIASLGYEMQLDLRVGFYLLIASALVGVAGSVFAGRVFEKKPSYRVE